MNIESITNYMRISDRISSSGQPDESQFKGIASAKYKVVINLAMPNSENAIPEEGNIVTAYNMIYIHIPVPFEAPQAFHLRKFMKVMTAVSDEMLWIHCAVNYRVSAFLYQYERLINGATHEEAKSVMLPSWKPNDVWMHFMELSIEDIAL